MRNSEKITTIDEALLRQAHLEDYAKAQWPFVFFGSAAISAPVVRGWEVLDFAVHNPYCETGGSTIVETVCKVHDYFVLMNNLGKLWELGVFSLGVFMLGYASFQVMRAAVEHKQIEMAIIDHQYVGQ